MKHKPFTRILSMLLAVATLVGLLAVPASAASLNGSGTVTIQQAGFGSYLSKSTGGSIGGGYWKYTSNDGLTGTAYCVKRQAEYMDSYAANIQKAMELGVDKGLIQKLSDGSEESARILAEIVSSGEEEIAALNDEFRKVEKGKDDFSKTVAELETDFSKKMEEIKRELNKTIAELNQHDAAYTAGQDNIQGLISGTFSKTGALIAAYAKMGSDAINAYKEEVDQHSPSRKFFQAGRYDIQGVIQGAEAERRNLDAKYKELAQTALYNMEHHLPARIVEPSASAVQERQAQAVAAAFQAQSSGAGGFTIHIDRVEVRDDQDVNRIARKLYQLIQQEYRGRGGGGL